MGSVVLECQPLTGVTCECVVRATIVTMADSANSASEASQCLGGCGFFGHPNTKGYCSMCYADLREKADPRATDVIDSVLAGTRGEDGKPSEETHSKAAAVAEEVADVPQVPKKKVQKKKSRCWSCNKRVGLLGFTCKCQYVFCSAHRMAETHECDFDYQNEGKEILANALGEACVADKISKI